MTGAAIVRKIHAVQALGGNEPSGLRLLALVICVATFLGIAHSSGWAQLPTGIGGLGNNPYAIGLWGDVPYNSLQKTVGVPNLIADMNSQNLAFTAHDGDLKSGSGPCPNSLYSDALAMFNTLTAPAIFTPGDNDWTDCDRATDPNTGQPYNSLERLDYERSVLFSTPYTLGGHPFLQEVQTATPDAYCLNAQGQHVACVENRRWTVGNVTYATLNVQGSCNNLCDTAPDPAEFAARNAADIAWLHETFMQARAEGSAAVMIISQADPGFDRSDATRAPLRDPQTLAETDTAPDGFQAFLTALRNETIAFAR